MEEDEFDNGDKDLFGDELGGSQGPSAAHASAADLGTYEPAPLGDDPGTPLTPSEKVRQVIGWAAASTSGGDDPATPEHASALGTAEPEHAPAAAIAGNEQQHSQLEVSNTPTLLGALGTAQPEHATAAAIAATEPQHSQLDVSNTPTFQEASATDLGTAEIVLDADVETNEEPPKASDPENAEQGTATHHETAEQASLQLDVSHTPTFQGLKLQPANATIPVESSNTSDAAIETIEQTPLTPGACPPAGMAPEVAKRIAENRAKALAKKAAAAKAAAAAQQHPQPASPKDEGDNQQQPQLGSTS